ncbi:MAG: enoyl-CoA hydratase/isomerase family protein [Bacteroidota bacterium]
MGNYQHIKIIEDGGAIRLVFSRAPLNVLNIAMMREVNAALAEIRKNRSAKVLIIAAEGKAFSAGVDVSEHTANKVGEMMKEFGGIFTSLQEITIPVIAIVEGAALGGGCEVAIFCDMIIASEKAKFGQPEILVGVFPPIAAAIMPRLIKRNRALELLMTGDTISATEAERIGLINKVFPVEGFADKANEFIGKITRQSKIILEMTKRAVDMGLGMPVMEAIHRAEKYYLDDMMKTQDANEGLSAFIEKRPPVWKNK